ncbi:hypothetical protein VKA52_15915 [Halobacillus sp. HZG1]|uniref:hypothetical protein n=1 Tax=Halobacillus sp. HZG1 TaxID=3111769 RepID=UPI002DBD54FF|nr:hypothetical protein [Halobacillus sp. HZG1]MEC3885221.1 hypothetical protein [Halobacillus sp. HZG1]
MNTYEKNYWGLYLDFLTSFREWKYHNLPLSLCVHFPTMINGMAGLEQSLVDPSYAKSWSDGKVLQGRFEAFLPIKEAVKVNHGKVVYYDPLLGIPPSSYKQLSSPAESLILKPDITNVKKKQIDGAVIKGLSQYAVDIEGQARKEIKRFHSIAGKHKNHPLFGNRHFLLAIKKQIEKILYFIEGTERFLMEVDTSLIVFGETNSIDTRALALAARKKGIPTLCLQHGAVISPFGYLPKVADYQGVYGRYEQTLYESRGVDPDFLPILGHPRFDEMVTRNNLRASSFNKTLGIHPSRKRILLIDHHTDKKMTHQILDLLLVTAPEVELIVKIKKGVRAFDGCAKHKRVHLIRRMHLYDMLPNVDAVISYESTVVLESMLYGRENFVWKLKQPGLTDYFTQLPVLTYSTAEPLVEEVRTFLDKRSDQSGQQSVQLRERFYIPSHQKSTLLLKALIASLRT